MLNWKAPARLGIDSVLLAGFHPGQLSFLLRATSDTLPTAINLRRWSVQCNSKCLLCDSSRPTTAHVLNGCPVALNQQRYTYRHNQVISALATMLTNAFADCPSIQVFADLNNDRACEALQATIPTSILITPYRLILLCTIRKSILLLCWN